MDKKTKKLERRKRKKTIGGGGTTPIDSPLLQKRERYSNCHRRSPSGCNFTRAWLKTANDELFKEEDVDPGEDGGGSKWKKEESEDVMMDTTSRGYVNQKDRETDLRVSGIQEDVEGSSGGDHESNGSGEQDLKRVGEQCVKETEEAGGRCHVEATEDHQDRQIGQFPSIPASCCFKTPLFP
uniref:Uncharacterized protein n=1 Tax=Caenorhabditis tropicalis TaxID=1561998 RepID=A0A1I7U2C6_9PELO